MKTLEVHSPGAALRHCEQVTRQRARNFYYGLKLLPEPKRSALYALYAWMRKADDITDEAGLDDAARRARLARFRELTDAALAGDVEDRDPLWAAMAYAAARFPLPPEHFHEMLDGQLDDLAHRRYRTFGQLREYCHRVASTVGLLCIEIWGYRDPAARELARDRGIAFQLTNMVRDFAQDFDAGRVYLPQEEFDAARLAPEDLRAWTRPEACRRFMRSQIDRAAGYYRRSEGLDGLVADDCRPTLWAMTSIYRALLDKAAEHPERIVSGRRLRLSSLTKAAIAFRAGRMMWAADGGNART